MRRGFRRKTSKFSSLGSLIVLSAMFVLFFLFMPEFIVSTAGRIFVGTWAFAAILSFIAHGRSVAGRERRQYAPVFGIKGSERTPVKRVRPTSSMRGL